LDKGEPNKRHGINQEMFVGAKAWTGADAKSLDLLHAGSGILLHGNGVAVRNDNGIPEGLDQLKSLGNSIVPHQVYPIYQAIADIEAQSAGE
jgi:DNA (cytosine-5)-methyltransferase 1